MSAYDAVRAGWPGADDSICEFVIWGRTPFPFASVTHRDLFKAASRFRRALQRDEPLCELCDRHAMPGSDLCMRCTLTMQRSRYEWNAT